MNKKGTEAHLSTLCAALIDGHTGIDEVVLSLIQMKSSLYDRVWTQKPRRRENIKRSALIILIRQPALVPENCAKNKCGG